MRPAPFFFALLLLGACGEKDPSDSAPDTEAPTDSTPPEDSEPPEDTEAPAPEDADGDGDGTDAETDCDDSDPDIFPGAPELCNGADDDCDGDTDEGYAEDAQIWFADADGDLFGDPSQFTVACTQPEGYVSDLSDCDDTDAAVSPEGTELCNSLDDDCDGQTDEDSAQDAATWLLDADGDGYGRSGTESLACEAPAYYVAQDGDCDDLDAAVSPEGTELCNELDDNCDGSIDEDSAADAPTWYADADQDGYGDPDSSLLACEAPTYYLADASDCDDTDSTVSPEGTELCDSVDNNCDGAIDEDSAADAPTWYADTDNDGYGDPDNSARACAVPSGYLADDSDCDDSDDTLSPDAEETCDGLDNDCDGDIDWGMNVPLHYSTIKSALSAASSGDSICVAAGTYQENLDISKGVSLVGYEGSALTILDGKKSSSVVLIQSSGVELRGFSIQNGSSSTGSALQVLYGDALLDDLDIHDNACGSVASCYGPLYLGYSTVTLSNSTLRDHTVSSNTGNGALVAVYVASDLTMENVKLVDNTIGIASSGSLIYNGSKSTLVATNVIIAGNSLTHNDGGTTVDGLLSQTGSNGATLTNVAIVGNYLDSGSGTNYGIFRLNGNTDTLTLINSTISDNGVISSTGRAYGLVYTAKSPTFSASYNNIVDNSVTTAFTGVSDPIGSSGNIEVYPGYVDTSASAAADWDLSLASGSALIDAGDPSVLDVDGSTSDIGAYGGPGGSWD